eukprot:12438702-Alexandrium_andersonii.AAC.1
MCIRDSASDVAAMVGMLTHLGVTTARQAEAAAGIVQHREVFGQSLVGHLIEKREVAVAHEAVIQYLSAEARLRQGRPK